MMHKDSSTMKTTDFGLNAFAFEQDKDAEINAYFDNILQEKSADPSNKRDVKKYR